MAIYNISSGVTSTGVTVTAADYMYVSDGGYASETIVDFAGIMHVRSGGTASSTIMHEGADMYVSSLGRVGGTTMSGGKMVVSEGGFVDGVHLSSGVQILTGRNAAAGGTYLYDDGFKYVSSGGTGFGDKVSGGLLVVYSGGNEFGAEVRKDGYVKVSGGYAKDIWLYNTGSMFVTNGGTVDKLIVQSGGWVGISGGTVTDITMYGASSGGGSRAGTMFVSGVGAAAYDIDVYDGARLIVRSGGVAGDTRIVTNGSMHISSGGTHTGSMYIYQSGDVVVDKGGVIDFNLTRAEPDKKDGLVDNLSYVSGSPSFTLTVGEIQAGGMYKLAGGASGFDKTVTVIMDGETIGTLMVGEGSIDTGANIYSLALSGGLVAKVDARNIFTGDLTSATKDITSGWYATAVNVNVEGILNVFDGGLANKNTVNSNGKMVVSDGGKATNTTVKTNGKMVVISGGTATNTKLYQGKAMVVSFGGVANDINLVLDGTVNVYGGTATGIELRMGDLHISSGGTATGVTTEKGADIYVYDGVLNDLYVEGTARVEARRASYPTSAILNNATVGSSGNVQILSSGVANGVTVTSGGNMRVESGGVANDVTVNDSKGRLRVESGGVVNNAVLDGGDMVVCGGVANDTTVEARGSLNVSYGGVANGVTVNSLGRVYVEKDGVVSGATVNAGYLYVSHFESSGGTATDTTVNLQGVMSVASYTIARNTTVNSGGKMNITGTANGVTVGDGGRMTVSSGGKLTGKVTLETGCVVSAEMGAIIDFDISGATSGAAALYNDLSLIVTGGDGDPAVGVATDPVYTLTVSDFQENGTFRLAGGAADFDKTITVMSDAAVTPIVLTVDGGPVEIGGVTYELTLNESVLTVTVAGGADHVFTGDLTSATKDITSGWYASAVNVNAKGILNILSGGLANKTQVNAADGLAYQAGSVRISDGGEANGTTVNPGGEFLVSSGGTATNTTLYDGMTVCSGGVAEDVSLLADCILHVSGGTATGIDLAAGKLDVDSGGTAINVRGSRGTEILVYGGIVKGLYTEGSVYVDNLHVRESDSASAIVSSATLGTGARMTLDNGGIASDTVVNPGVLDIRAGGTASDVTVSSGGSMLIASDGKLTGTVTLEDGCYVSAGMGAIIDFDISMRSPGTDVLYNDLSFFLAGDPLPAGGMTADPVFTLTVSDWQEAGTYYLAVGADGFDKTISVISDLAATPVALTVDGGPVEIGGATYELSLLRTLLTVTVTSNEKRVFTGDLTEETKDIPSGWIASSVNVNSEGILNILEGGDGDDIAVNSAGTLVVSSGGKAVRIKENGGFVRVKVDAEVEFSPNAFSGLALVDGYSATIHSGTTATATTVNDAGSLYILDGGIAIETTINKDSDVIVFEGGKAQGVTVNDGGYLDVYGGGTATGIKENGGYVMFQEDTVVTFVSNTFSGLVKAGANATAHSGTTAVATTLNEDGTLEVFEGGLASATIINAEGYLDVSSGGVAKDVTLNENGGLYINEGAKMTGVMTFDPDAVVYISTEAIVDFDISALSPSNAALLNNFALFEEMPLFTLTVSDTQANGSYSLAGGAAEFNETITIMNTLGATVGTLTVGGFGAVVGDRNYMLEIADSILTVTVSDAAEEDTVAPVVSGVRADETDPTNQAVTVTASFLDNSGVVSGFYRIGDGEWTDYPADGAGVTVEENATLYFKAVDEAGNESEVAEYTVANIDKVLPTITVTPSTTEPAASVTLTANYADNVGLATTIYKIGDGEWTRYDGTGVTLTENATVYFRAFDTASNETNESYTVANIRKIDPERLNKPDDGEDDILYDKKSGWNDRKIKVANKITGNGEINLDEPGSVDTEDGYHNMFGNDGKTKDAGDTAKISVEDAAKLTFEIYSDAAGTFYVYEDGVDKKGKRKLITVGKTAVRAGKSAKLEDICLTGDGAYYVSMIAKNIKREGTIGRYNVSVIDSTFFADADDKTNNTADEAASVPVERGTTAILLDENAMTGSTEFSNFVGLGDAVDFAKLDLVSSAYLSFHVTGEGDGKAKFTVWKQGANGKLSKVTNVSLPAKKAYDATTKAQFLDTSKYTYYVSMECTDAVKGKSLYYDVEVTDGAVFFDSHDEGRNNELYDKKAKEFCKEDADHHFESTSVGLGTKSVRLDSAPVGEPGYENFVGYGDAADYAKIKLTSGGKLSFHIEATGDATFTFYRKGEKKGRETLEAVQSVKLAVAKGETTVAQTMDVSTELEAGEYYVSMVAKNTKPTDKGSVFYNVTAFFTAVDADALDMPMAASSYADSVQDKLLGESGNGLLASL